MKIGDMYVQTIDRTWESHVQSIKVYIIRDNISFRNQNLKLKGSQKDIIY